jgi:hypothetical protein
VIGPYLSELLLRYVFVDPGSPFAETGFLASLHTEGTASGVGTELVAPSYSRLSLGQGPEFWEVGARSVSSTVDIVFPDLAEAEEAWRGIRSIALWPPDAGAWLLAMQFDDPGLFVDFPDRLRIPAGQLQWRFVNG